MVCGITKQLETKNVENIVNLFDEKVEYDETPIEKVNTMNEIIKLNENNKCIFLKQWYMEV